MKPIEIRDIATSKSDSYAVEVVQGDNTRAALQVATAADVTAGTDANAIVTPAALAGASIVTVPDATETVKGKSELATTAECITGTDTTRIVTPAGLAAGATTHVAAASDTVAGKIEIATSAECVAVTDQTRAVTPYGLGAALAKLYAVSFPGRNGAGAITVTGAAVSDVIFSVTDITSGGLVDASFESVVSVINEIQQASVVDLSTKIFLALIYHPA